MELSLLSCAVLYLFFKYSFRSIKTMQPSVTQRKPFKRPRSFDYFSVMIAFYKIVQVVCCLDFGFFENKSMRTKVIWKSVTVFYLMTIICVCFYYTFVDSSITESNTYIVPSFIFFLIRYIVNVVYLVFFNPGNMFRQLLRDLEIVDTKMGQDIGSYNIDIKILVCIICNTLFLCTLGILSFPPDSMKLGLICSIMIMMVTSDSVVVVTCTFVFYSINCRLKNFMTILRNGKSICIYPMQLIYRSIADLTEVYKSAFDALFLTTLLFTTFEVMGHVIYIVNEIKVANSVQFGLNYIGLFIHLVSMFSPALYAEMIAEKANNVKLILHDKLINEQSPTHQLDLEWFIRYVEARPLRFRVYKVIPLDASLFGMVLNFIVTYLIVILQFMFKQ